MERIKIEDIDELAGDLIELIKPELDSDSDEHDRVYTVVHNFLKETWEV